MKFLRVVFLFALAFGSVEVGFERSPGITLLVYRNGKALGVSTVVLAQSGDKISLKTKPLNTRALRWFQLIPFQKPYEIKLVPPLGSLSPIRVEYEAKE